MDNLHLYICCFFGILVIGFIIYEDVKNQQVSDFWIIFLAALFILKNGFSFDSISDQTSFLFMSVGATYLNKIIFENIIFNFTNGNNFEFGEADVFLIGVLGMNFSLVGYILFIYVTFILWLGLLIYKYYFIKKTTVKQNTYVRTAFVPYVFGGALIVYLLSN